MGDSDYWYPHPFFFSFLFVAKVVFSCFILEISDKMLWYDWDNLKSALSRLALIQKAEAHKTLQVDDLNWKYSSVFLLYVKVSQSPVPLFYGNMSASSTCRHVISLVPISSSNSLFTRILWTKPVCWALTTPKYSFQSQQILPNFSSWILIRLFFIVRCETKCLASAFLNLCVVNETTVILSSLSC